MPRASVLVPAYNEEQNIGPLLGRLAAESADGWKLDEIIVIASGCSDGTVAKARATRLRDGLLRVIVEPERAGKASAINIGLRNVRNDVVVLVSGDVMPARGAVVALLRHLTDRSVGTVGGRPVPLNDASSFTGWAAHVMWRLHHEISAASPDNPKCGEMIAFRRALDGQPVVPSIPLDTAVDEVSIQALVHGAGLRSVYAPEAIVSTWGPATVRDWFTQRRRINAGHILAARQGYHPSTMNARAVLRRAWRDGLVRRHPLRFAAVASLEVAARVAGRIDVARRRSHAVWKVATTTKRHIEQEAS